jgi:hypothetical protein
MEQKEFPAPELNEPAAVLFHLVADGLRDALAFLRDICRMAVAARAASFRCRFTNRTKVPPGDEN